MKQQFPDTEQAAQGSDSWKENYEVNWLLQLTDWGIHATAQRGLGTENPVIRVSERRAAEKLRDLETGREFLLHIFS